jgi:hypothetical protein
MRFFSSKLILLAGLAAPLVVQAATNPFLGRWDFDVKTASGVGANWLGVTQKGDTVEIWFQPTGGHVHPVTDFKIDGSHLTMQVAPATAKSPGTTWDLDAAHGKLTGVEKKGDKSMALEGVPAPELKRAMPKAWSKPEPLFDGKDLDGWMPIGDPAKSHWMVKDGMLVNETHGANLESKRKFTDFKLHFEVNCPDDANSGFYLRGRYEVQLEYVPEHSEPVEREMGSVYGRLAPSTQLPRKPGTWETFDITLVGRMVTVVRNGVTIIDNKEIEGITGGALDADEGKPGPFYIQGDHTGGLMFRNITVETPKG